MSQHTPPRRLAYCAVVLAALLGGSLARAEGETPGPLKEILENTGLIWTPAGSADDAWQINFEDSEGAGTINVFLTYNDDNRQYALAFATVVDRPEEYEYGKDVLVECMKLNNNYPGIKFCLDFDHGDIDCQSEELISTLTAVSLKLSLERVAGFANEYGTKLRDLEP